MRVLRHCRLPAREHISEMHFAEQHPGMAELTQSHLIILPQSLLDGFVECDGGSTVYDVCDRLRQVCAGERRESTQCQCGITDSDVQALCIRFGLPPHLEQIAVGQQTFHSGRGCATTSQVISKLCHCFAEQSEQGDTPASPFLSRTMMVILDNVGTLDSSRSRTTLPRKPVAPASARLRLRCASAH